MHLNESDSNTVDLQNITATEAVDIKQRLVRDYGLTLGQDFTWSFIPPIEDSGWGSIRRSAMRIVFDDPKLATFFKVRFLS